MTGPANVQDLSTRVISPALEAAGMKDVWAAFYACRRGWGTDAYNHGLPVEIIAAFMGNSPAVVMANYVKDRNAAAARASMMMDLARKQLATGGRLFRQPVRLTEGTEGEGVQQ